MLKLGKKVVINQNFPHYDFIVILFSVVVVQIHPGDKMTNENIVENMLLIFNVEFILLMKQQKMTVSHKHNECVKN